MTAEHLARRLAQLEGVTLPPGDLERIVAEWEQYERALVVLEAFAEASPWPALPVQP
jgi:hypothetical protein